MTFEEIADQALAMLQRRGRVAYRMLKRQFQLNDEALEDLKAELIDAQHVAADEDGNVLVWTGGTASPPTPAAAPESAPRTCTPPHLAEKILTSRGALEGERKQVTVLFADLRARWSCWPTAILRTPVTSSTRSSNTSWPPSTASRAR